jgi:hypothetical protein
MHTSASAAVRILLNVIVLLPFLYLCSQVNYITLFLLLQLQIVSFLCLITSSFTRYFFVNRGFFPIFREIPYLSFVADFWSAVCTNFLVDFCAIRSFNTSAPLERNKFLRQTDCLRIG